MLMIQNEIGLELQDRIIPNHNYKTGYDRIMIMIQNKTESELQDRTSWGWSCAKLSSAFSYAKHYAHKLGLELSCCCAKFIKSIICK